MQARSKVTPARTPAEWRRLAELAEDAGREDLAFQARKLRHGDATRRDPLIVEALVYRSAAVGARLHVAQEDRDAFSRRADALEGLWRGDLAA